jgi:methyl-accepting chemotaxis protein
MTGEEMERAIAFTLEQQAHLTATVGHLSEKVDLMAEKVDLMAEKVDKLSEKVDRTADGVTALLAIAEIQAAEIRDLTESTRTLADRQRETDERLNALINTVERYISEGRNGKA